LSSPEPGPAELSKEHERQGRTGARGERKEQGRFYTDSGLAEGLVELTLAPFLDADPEGLLELRICDPSVGAGAFLLAALQKMANALPASMGEKEQSTVRQRICSECLHGVDKDPRAVELARGNLNHAIASAAGIDLSRQVRCGDAILGLHRERPQQLQNESGFLWHRAFAPVMAEGGFHAIIGNPPWDILKPDSRAFFSRYEPSYRGMTKQDALACQRRLFTEDPEIESQWKHVQERHRLFAAMLRDRESPLQHTGAGDLNSYKLFLELSIHLLRPGGRLGMLVPAGIYSDLGCAPLRRFMLDENRWEVLLGFENRNRVFEIDGRFKFAAVVLQKGQRTNTIRSAFMRSEPSIQAADADAVPLERDLIAELSPGSLAIPEIQSHRDHDLLAKIHADSLPFSAEGESSWQIEYRRELDLTLDAHRFAARDELEKDGFRADRLGRWRHQDGRMAFPLIEGRMIDAFRDHQKRWESGRGRRAIWRSLQAGECDLGPQYLVEFAELEDLGLDPEELKIAFMAIGSATNHRSMYAASILGMPCGNSAPTLRCPEQLHLPLLAVLNSFVYDYALRARLGGNNLNHYILRDTPVPCPLELVDLAELTKIVASLSWPVHRFSAAWRRQNRMEAHWISSHRERRQARARIEALVARSYGLNRDDLALILRDCEHSVQALRDREFTRTLDQKGFWRVDRDLDPAHRLSQLALSEMAKLES
jgi:hypothetical protein